VTLSGGISAVADPAPRLVATAAPNPFSGQTSLSFSLEKTQKVSLGIYDLAGRRLRQLVDADLGPGGHFHSWNGRDAAGRKVPAGVYFYRLEVEGVVETKRLTLVR
jgi:flagellar hook assembly protein FlgD